MFQAKAAVRTKRAKQERMFLILGALTIVALYAISDVILYLVVGGG